MNVAFSEDSPLRENLKSFLGNISTKENPCQEPKMEAGEVMRLLHLAQDASIPLIIDGGWAVDAHLKRQTREHADLDVALDHQHLPLLLELLAGLGYAHIHTGDEWVHNFVLEDATGHRVDIHSFITDGSGRVKGGVAYPDASLTGSGQINDAPVTCISAPYLVEFHTGYTFDDNDYQDMRLLCEHYHLPLPAEYMEYERRLYNTHTH